MAKLIDFVVWLGSLPTWKQMLFGLSLIALFCVMVETLDNLKRRR